MVLRRRSQAERFDAWRGRRHLLLYLLGDLHIAMRGHGELGIFAMTEGGVAGKQVDFEFKNGKLDDARVSDDTRRMRMLAVYSTRSGT